MTILSIPKYSARTKDERQRGSTSVGRGEETVQWHNIHTSLSKMSI